MQTTEKALLELANGFRKSFPHSEKFSVNGVSHKPLEFANELERLTTPYREAREAHIAFNGKTRVRDEGHPATHALVLGVQTFLRGHFGASSEQLLSFGVEPKKQPATLTAAEKAAKADKARLTRAKNGKGSKKKGPNAGTSTGSVAS
jgi:hypothetical protein